MVYSNFLLGFNNMVACVCQAYRVLSMSSTVSQTEESVVSVVIIVGDANDHSPEWSSVFPAISLTEVKNRPSQ